MKRIRSRGEEMIGKRKFEAPVSNRVREGGLSRDMPGGGHVGGGAFAISTV